MSVRGLAPDFHFSQSNLQDYVDCPRRFELRYMLRQAWPAVQAQPIQRAERQMWLGSAFHRLIHQYLIGIPSEVLTQGIDDEDLRRWWRAFVNAGPRDLPETVRLAEVSLFTYVAGYRLTAQYDLIAADEVRITVVDWKTNHRRPSSSWLASRLQTRVYPYVALETRQPIANIAPEQVSMVYWFAEFPHQPEWFRYSRAQHQENADFLEMLIAEIAVRQPGDFPLTEDERRCRFCVYRSLCEKDLPAGDLTEDAEVEVEMGEQDWPIDLEQAAEVAY